MPAAFGILGRILRTSLDSGKLSGGPFASDGDTHNVVFQSHFQWADLVLAGIDDGVRIRFMNNTFEGAVSKSAFHKEFVPVLNRYTDRFSVGGDDPDCDGKSDDGRELAHEYDLPNVLNFLTPTGD